MDLRTTAEANVTRPNEDFYTMSDSNQSLRSENEDLVDRIRDLDATVAQQAYVLQQLKDRYGTSEADCAAAMRYVEQERERPKAGLVVYNAELTKLRQYLEENDPGSVSSPSPRMKALLAENTSLRRANSILRRNSAEHGLNTDALVLSTAGISARDINWELLVPSSPPAQSPPTPTPTEDSVGGLDDDMGGGSDGEASGAESGSTSVSRQSSVVTESSVPQSESEVVDLTSDEVVTEAQGDGSSPFSSPNLSLPRKDGRPRRSVSFASDLRVKENLEREMADDDFVLGTEDEKDQPKARSAPAAASDPAAGSPSVVVQSPRSPPVSTSRPTVPISQLLNDVDADLAELEVPVEAEQDTGQAEASVGAELDASQPEVLVDVEPNTGHTEVSGDAEQDAGQAEVSVDAEQDAGQAEVSATPSNGLAEGSVTEESRNSDVDQDTPVDLGLTATATIAATAEEATPGQVSRPVLAEFSEGLYLAPLRE
ncbi:hypothetical protein PHMEG_00031500 [Phytophthora megakarya]|uniref:Uncharacterized protein n=1 Tax=Phytophthora megakarya TaxID=4795 RepID=A0A225UXZ6_9STRA|nr:hypothetical protein PHMEG_00031500 [Phytophthora megakarya]